MIRRRLAAIALLVMAPASGAVAQPTQWNDPFLGSVPAGEVSAAPLGLTLRDVITRGLQHNLGLLIQDEAARAAHGARWRAMSDLLPHVSGAVGERRQVINLEAFGFPAPDPVVGPFNVFDARVSLSQPLVDLAAVNDARAAARHERAAVLGIRTARELVVLASVNLYLEAVAAGSRVEVARAQLSTAETLLTQASNLKASGLVAGIDVVRAQAQVQAQRHRLSVTENDLEKAGLRLARAIGLPLGQAITLEDAMPYAPLAAVSVETALAEALARRPDYLAAAERLAAAEATASAALAERLPSLHLDADYGVIGQQASNAHATYTIAATVRVPVFEGGRVHGRRSEAEAGVRQRRAEYEDFKGRIEFEVRTALLDVRAAAQQIEVADTAVTLAAQELEQARDRFAAGVAGNIEVVRAQESVAAAAEARIAALYHHNVARAMLARAIGLAEEAVSNIQTGAK